MKALVLNALGQGFDFEDVDIALPIGREVLIHVQASGLCHTDLLFATHDIAPTPSVLGHEVAGIVAAGQDRAAGTRLLVPRSRLDEVKRGLRDAMSMFTVGDPADPNTAIGPMVSQNQ